jgi:hypothetical protein
MKQFLECSGCMHVDDTARTASDELLQEALVPRYTCLLDTH